MNVYMAQAKIKTEKVPGLQAAANLLFAAIDAAQPEGIRYAWYQLADGQTFMAFVQVDDGAENPIPDLPEYRQLQEHLDGWLAEPPSSQPLTVLGDYRMS